MEKKPTNKKRVVTSYKNLVPEVLEEVKKKYPNGWDDYLIRVEKAPGDFFYAITLDTPDVSYLIKVDVKIDNRKDDDDDKDLFEDDEADSSNEDFSETADESYEENDE